MTKLNYTRDELMADHAYARPHEAAGYRLHGGFDAEGVYHSPRTLNRWPAVIAWQKALKERGWPVIDATTNLLKRGNYPNAEQQRFLISHGFGQTFWNTLTITGIIEARGKALCELMAPDFADVIEDDVSEMAIGHLNEGLLYSHGMDEGGDPDDPSIGAHDQMWFAARDLLFGKDAYPIPEVPESISRPVEEREFPQLPENHEAILSLLLNVLMIEVRAEAGFAFSIEVMRDPALWQDRREAAELAATLVERIRTDEAIHVGYLQTVISEMRSVTFKTVDGGRIEGHEMIDPIWDELVKWHGETQFDLNRERVHEQIVASLGEAPDGKQLIAEFESLAGSRPLAAE